MLMPIVQRLMTLVSLAILGLAGWLAWSWWEIRDQVQLHDPAADPQDWRIWTAAALLAFSLLGRFPMLLLLGRGGRPAAEPPLRKGEIRTASGAVLKTVASGPAQAPVLVMVHGWGLSAREWREQRAALSERFEVLTYDLPGLGDSTRPSDGKVSIERFADDLRDVVQAVSPRRAVVVGHSIGGMTVQTFLARHGEMMGREVAGAVLLNTTHTNPLRTTVLDGVLYALQPLVRAFMWLDIVLMPLAWLANWQGYLSGSVHLAMRLTGFGTRPTREQLDRVALDASRNSPAVQARGNLAMMDWGVTAELPRLPGPSLVLWGGRDIVTVPEAGEVIARSVRDGEGRPVDGAGHLGPIELAADYAQAIARFADTAFTAGAIAADRPPQAVITEIEPGRREDPDQTGAPRGRV